MDASLSTSFSSAPRSFLVIGPFGGVEAGKDGRLGLRKTGQGRLGRAGDIGDRVADTGITYALDTRRDQAYFARSQFFQRDQLGRHDRQARHVELVARAHHPDAGVAGQGAVEHTHQRDRAQVIVEPGVEDERAKRSGGVSFWGGDTLRDGLKNLVDALARLRADQDRLVGRDPHDLLDLLFDPFNVRAGQVDLVDHRHDHKVQAGGEIGVGQSLRLHSLSGVDDQKRPLARFETAGNLVGKVDVARRVDQVEDQILASLRTILKAYRLCLDRDPRASRSRSMRSRYWSTFLRICSNAPVFSRRRSASVDLP